MNPETLKAMKEVTDTALRTPMWRMDSRAALDFEQFVNPTNVSALIAEVERQAREIAELRDIVDALADTGKCHYDHHGYCQEHLWFKSDVECPHARAQKLWDADGEVPATDLAHSKGSEGKGCS